jgi:hypothetical protein
LFWPLTNASLAERIYTDPKMIDVRKWVDQLPELRLVDEESPITAKATGTDGELPPASHITLHDPASSCNEGG